MNHTPVTQPSHKPVAERTLQFYCSQHGLVAFKSFCYGGIELSCGCQFLFIYNRGLVYHETPPWQKKPALQKSND